MRRNLASRASRPSRVTDIINSNGYTPMISDDGVVRMSTTIDGNLTNDPIRPENEQITPTEDVIDGASPVRVGLQEL